MRRYRLAWLSDEGAFFTAHAVVETEILKERGRREDVLAFA
ncbi:hypothetical protein [Rhodoferax sediminis]|nr:hypothetical protein [Rhodoferax sediminis]